MPKPKAPERGRHAECRRRPRCLCGSQAYSLPYGLFAPSSLLVRWTLTAHPVVYAVHRVLLGLRCTPSSCACSPGQNGRTPEFGPKSPKVQNTDFQNTPFPKTAKTPDPKTSYVESRPEARTAPGLDRKPRTHRVLKIAPNYTQPVPAPELPRMVRARRGYSS
jgi:hypothetical protein